MKQLIAAILIGISYSIYAGSTVYKVGEWIREHKVKCLAVGGGIAFVTTAAEYCANSSCSIPLKHQISDFARDAIRNIETPLCNSLYPIREFASYMAESSRIITLTAVCLAHLGNIPQPIRAALVTNCFQNCFLGLCLSFGNIYLDTYIRWGRSTIGPFILDCGVCNTILPAYAAWAPCFSACCITIPPLLCCLAKVGDCCAGDADKED